MSTFRDAFLRWMMDWNAWIDRHTTPLAASQTDPYAFELWWCDREHDPGDEDRS